MKKLFIIALFLYFTFPIPLQAELIDNNDGTLTDTVSGLVWRTHDNGYDITKSQALLYIQEIDSKYSWRLPSVSEMQDFGKQIVFPEIIAFWTNWSDKFGNTCVVFFPALPSGYVPDCFGTAHVFAVREKNWFDKKYSQFQIDEAITDAVSKERARWDANGDNKIGLEEAIRDLQIVSGIRNP